MTIPIPPTSATEEPTTCVRINELWIPVLLGALQSLLNPPNWTSGYINPKMINPNAIWEGDEEANRLAEQQILKIMDVLMLGNCEDDMPTGSVSAFVGTIAPEGYLLCDGASYEKAAYPSLWGVLSLHGAIFEEDTTHFIVPDLRGRVIVGAGQGMGLTNRLVGQFDGFETHTLEVNELPVHEHNVPYTIQLAGALMASGGDFDVIDFTASPASTSETGNDQAHNNMPPFFVLNFIIKT